MSFERYFQALSKTWTSFFYRPCLSY